MTDTTAVIADTHNPLSFLSDPNPPAAPVVDAPVVEAPAATQDDASNTGAVRDANGRFVAKAGATTPATADPASDDAAVGDGRHVPVSALQAEREKRQAAEARATAAEARANAHPTPQRPDPNEDPDGARDYDLAVQDARLYNLNLTMSRKFAVRQYGDDLINRVQEWANAKCEPGTPTFDLAFNTQVMKSDDPYETIVQAYNRDRVLQAVQPDELDEFQAWKAAKANGGTPAVPSTTTAQTPIPRTLASAPNASVAHGRETVVAGPGQAFAAVFNNRR